MGTYTYTGHDYPTESKWIVASDPYACNHPEHGGATIYDPSICLAGHITTEGPDWL